MPGTAGEITVMVPAFEVYSLSEDKNIKLLSVVDCKCYEDIQPNLWALMSDTVNLYFPY